MASELSSTDDLLVSPELLRAYREKEDANGKNIFNRYIDNIAKAGIYIGMHTQRNMPRENLHNINWSEWDKVPKEYQTAEFLDAMHQAYRENIATNACNCKEAQLVMSFFHRMAAEDAERPYKSQAVPDMFAELNIGPVLSIEEIFSRKHELDVLMKKCRENSNAKTH